MKRTNIPSSMIATYEKAVAGKSRKAAIIAMCQECMGYGRKEVRNCTDAGCPLYAFRPYVGKEDVDDESADEGITDDTTDEE